MQKNRQKRRFDPIRLFSKISKESLAVLKIGLPFIVAALAALSIKMHKEIGDDPIRVITTYPDMFSYIFAALTLLILGAALFDIISKNR